jgi:hypothetical protein
MSDIDYERLAKAAYTGFCGYDPDQNNWLQYVGEADAGSQVRDDYIESARAVVAALADQGYCVARRDDLTRAIGWHTAAEWHGATDQDDQDARDRLAAPPWPHRATTPPRKNVILTPKSAILRAYKWSAGRCLLQPRQGTQERP